MRLKTFLKEGIESTKGWKIISTFTAEEQDTIKTLFDGLKQFKLLDEKFEQDEGGSHATIKFIFGDGLVEVSFIVEIRQKKDSEDFESYFIMVSAKVDAKHLLQVKDNRPDISYFSLFRASEQNEAKEKLQTFNSTVETFTDWYFDLTAQYGKVKLFKTFYDIIGGSHDSNKPRFVALAGDFQVTDEIDGTKTLRVEPRIL